MSRGLERLGDALDLTATTPPARLTSVAETTDIAVTWPPREPPSGDPITLGRYRVIQLLGRGAFGRVYLAEDSALTRQVAIKVTSARRTNRSSSAGESASSAEVAADADRGEAKTLARLDHPAIVPVFDVGRTEAGEHYVVAKYIAGSSLAQRISADGMAPREAAQLIARVCDGLQHAHERGIVHRDIKPANILLDEQSQPLVADFGLALHEGEQLPSRGEVAGTPAYMSPEQVRGQAHHLDGRTDIWSVGVVLYELLSGRRPFAGASAAALFDEIVEREPKPLRLVNENIPLRLESIVTRCLRKDVADRYATAADVAADLRSWLAEDASPSARRPKAGPDRWWFLVGSLVACALCAVLAIAIWRPRPDASVPHATPSPSALTGGVSLRVWSPSNPARRGRLLEEPGMLPLLAGDQIRVEAALSQPAYAYILWINAAGEVSPVYPWRPGDWNSRPATEQKVTRISLPEEQDTGWELEPPAGMETLVLLARSEPLPADLDLQRLMAGLPPQPQQSDRALVWLDDGHLAQELTRAPRFFDAKQIDDPLLQAQRQLQERLAPHFSLLRAISFANSSESVP